MKGQAPAPHNMDQPQTKEKMEEDPTFESVFFGRQDPRIISVPDFQRAYSWELKQIDLFITDLQRHEGKGGYYFGHFIVEEEGGRWEVVDGQQRLTTFVLFLMVCRHLDPDAACGAYPLIDRFTTVTYDTEAFGKIRSGLGSLLRELELSEDGKPPAAGRIAASLGFREGFTRSQRRIVDALLRFDRAFKGGDLDRNRIAHYVDVVMNAQCSLHLTRDKSVAVNIFEMHNTRGVPLSTLEILKAKLMKFVHDHGGDLRNGKLESIQSEFGAIYAMEERLAEQSFRGEMTMEQILRLHLRAVDDGTKRSEEEFRHPALNAGAETLVDYVERRLRGERDGNGSGDSGSSGAEYAVSLAQELRKSVAIVSTHLPAWDEEEELVGDVMILERELGCQFFLIACRLFESAEGEADGRLDRGTLSAWEKLLFTRDFHDRYYNLRGSRDNFERLFGECWTNKDRMKGILNHYLSIGFREGRTDGLQGLVRSFVQAHRSQILNGAYGWHMRKMQYAIYKYEAHKGSNIRRVMKGTVSVEHILPQEWKWEWIEKDDSPPKPEGQPIGGRDQALREITSYVNGLGNLLLITGSENSSQGNNHPKDKRYLGYAGGSYKWHHDNLERWRSSSEWPKLIEERGVDILNFMMANLILPEEGPATITESSNVQSP